MTTMAKLAELVFGLLFLTVSVVCQSTDTLQIELVTSQQSQPRNFRVTSQESSTLTLKWEAPSSWAGRAIGYLIYPLDANGQYGHPTRLSGVQNTVFRPNRLRPLTNYTFSLVAVSLVGSDEIESDPLTLTASTTDFDAPSEPLNFRLVWQNSKQLHLAWDEPKNWKAKNGGYMITYGTENETVISVQQEGKDITSFTPDGIELGVWYTFNLTAYNYFEDEKNPKFGPVVQLEVEGKPAIPVDLHVRSISTSSLNVTWDKPVDESVNGYVVYFNNEKIPTTENEFSVSGLNPWTLCEFSVATYMSVNGRNFYSDNVTLSVHTNFSEPSAPANLTFYDPEERVLEVIWIEPEKSNGPLSAYRVVLEYEDSKIEIETVDTKHRFNDVRVWEYFNISVSAINKDHSVDPLEGPRVTKQGRIAAAPGFVDTLRKVDQLSTTLHITWTDPKTRNGPIDGFFVSLIDSVGNTSKLVQTSSHQHFFNDLEPWTEYIVCINAYNRGTLSLYSGPESKTTFRTNVGAPSVPLEVTVSEVTNTTIVVSWAEPEVFNGPEPQYQVKTEGGRLRYVVQSSDVNYTFSDLDPWTEYKITLKALNIEPDFKAEGPEVVLNCTTGPSAPPVPTDKMEVASKTKDSATLTVPKNLFSTEKGEIVEFVLLVTANNTGKNLPRSGYDQLNETEFPDWKTYSTTGNWFRASPMNWIFQKDTTICSDGDDKSRKCVAGNAKGCDGKPYCSGPLKENTDHWAKIRAYTNNGWSESEPVQFKTGTGAAEKVVPGLVVLLMAAFMKFIS